MFAKGSTAMDGRSGVARRTAEHLAQRRDMHGEIAFLDDRVGPDPIENLGLGDDAVAMFDEQHQHVEGPGAERHRAAPMQQTPLVGTNLEFAKHVAGTHECPSHDRAASLQASNRGRRCGSTARGRAGIEGQGAAARRGLSQAQCSNRSVRFASPRFACRMLPTDNRGVKADPVRPTTLRCGRWRMPAA